jgi:hypothetical protein
MSARGSKLPRIIPPAATLPEQHQACIFGAGRVRGGNTMPSAAMWAVQFITGMQRRIVCGVIAKPHGPIISQGEDNAGHTQRVYDCPVPR